jgi:hypothetical protein
MHTFTLSVAAVYPRIDIEAAVVRVCAYMSVRMYMMNGWEREIDRHTERERWADAPQRAAVWLPVYAAS